MLDISFPCSNTRPPCSVVCPMMVASSVVLPTPLRPMIDTVSLAPSAKRISSSTTVSPYPARTLSRSSAPSAMMHSLTAAVMAFLAEIDRSDLLVIHDLVGSALRAHGALHQDSDLFGKTKNDVHVVLDDQHCDVGIERGDHVEDKMTFRGRHAGRWLVEQKNARFLCQRDGNFNKPLTAIGQLTDQLEGIVGEPQRIQVVESLVNHCAPRACRAPQIIAMAVTLADGHAKIFDHREPAKKLIDLKGARKPTSRALGLARARNVIAVDQRASRSAFEPEIDIARHRQSAEGPIQPLNLQCGNHERFLSVKYSPTFSNSPSRPRGANNTVRTSTR